MDISLREEFQGKLGRLIKGSACLTLNDAIVSPIGGKSPLKRCEDEDRNVCKTSLNFGKLQPIKPSGREWGNLSFELNQSFPLIQPHFQKTSLKFINPRATMETIRGDSLNSCRFSSGRVRSSFSSMRPAIEGQSSAQDQLLPSEASTTVSATLCGTLSNSQPQAFHKSVMLNPNKAVFTFDFKTMQILVVNQIACRLLGFSPEEMCHLSLLQLLNKQHIQTANALSEEHLDTTHGTTVGVSGKVVEMISKDGNIIPVSLWLRRLQMDDRCLAVAEPVERRIAHLEVDANGNILWLDQGAAQLFQYKLEDVKGENINLLIPAILLPSRPDMLQKEVRKQKATGRTKHGSSFPLCLRLSEQLGDGSGDSSVAVVTYSIIVWVYSNMSGLLVLTPDGLVEQCNHHFTSIMFGYTQAQLVGKHITTILPNFTNDVECEGEDTIMPPFQLGDELAETALNTDSTTPHAWRSNDDAGSVSLNVLDSDTNSTNKISVDHSNRTDCMRLIESCSQLCDITNNIKLDEGEDDTTSAGLTLQNDTSPIKLYKRFSFTSRPASLSLKENSPPEDSSDQLVTADGTTCEDFSQSEDDALNGNGDSSVASHLSPDRPAASPCVNVELSACTGGATSSMCTCTSHPSRYDQDDNTLSAPSLSYAKPPAPSPVPARDGHEAYPEGHFVGFGKHKDGSNIDLVYQVRLVLLRCGRRLYCVWVSRDSEDEDIHHADLTFTSSLDSSAIEHSLGQEIQSQALSTSRPSSLSVLTQCEDELVMGEYGSRYTTLQQIGKGAYGYVKMAFRNSDGLLVITKFIHKKKVHEQSWLEDPSLGCKVPLEVSLLTTLKHPNIVRVLDVFENETFFQMVMEKHGAGMDLFEFVDRRPKLDEPLTSYIFRQIVGAVEYLHSLQILHRDIKDENVIIDQHFHAKLIDFGSATFMSANRLFSTFYGTVEYCSPEVLEGNKYEGPELEIWSLGVTLYVLTFGENPFFDVEETLRAELRPPGFASVQLLGLLHSMLDRDPAKRCTMQKLAAHPWIRQPVDPIQYRFEDIVNCLPEESDPPAFYMDYCQSRPISGTNEVHSAPIALTSNIDEDDDKTDLATSNSLTSLTPVDEAAPGVNFSLESGCIHQSKTNHCNDMPSSSTPLKASHSSKPSEVFSHSFHERAESSSSSISPASSSSEERTSSSLAISINMKENDSLAQQLLDDCSERLLSYAGAPLSPILGKPGGGLTDDDDGYECDDFENDDSGSSSSSNFGKIDLNCVVDLPEKLEDDDKGDEYVLTNNNENINCVKDDDIVE